MAPATSALPFILLLSLLAASSPSHSSLAPSSSPSSSPVSSPASKQGLSKTSISKVKRAAASTREWESSAKGSEEEEEEKDMTGMGKSTEGVHKIQARDAGPVRFWSGSRYGRSGRSARSGMSESESRGSHTPSTHEMTMSLRSSNLVVQPRHDRFFLGSRYGKRSQGQAEEWEGRRRGEIVGEEGEEEEVAEEEAPEENNEEGGERAEDAPRMLEEAMHFRAFGQPGNAAGVTSQRGPSLEIQPVSCVYTGIGNLYRCYDGRQEGTGVH